VGTGLVLSYNFDNSTGQNYLNTTVAWTLNVSSDNYVEASLRSMSLAVYRRVCA
jgi:hypothetical protein